MNRFVKIISAAAISAAMLASLSSCTLFSTMRENAEKAAQQVIFDTPEDGEAAQKLNAAINGALADAVEINEDISLSVGSPSLTKDGGDAGLLGEAANMLKKFIMASKPGSSSQIVTPENAKLLKEIDFASIPGFTLERNLATVSVTDEDGDEVLNDDGTVKTEQVIDDNTLKITVEFFETVENTASGSDAEPEYKTAGTRLIEEYFGELRSKTEVLEGAESVADYLIVGEYEIAYADCRIYAEINLETGRLTSYKLEKKMNVTASVTGVGALAEYGDMQLSFDATETTAYSFTYPEDIEAENATLPD